jgi:Protein of unknown function (DUF1549)/Protein of unknown function (DUF1553)
MTGFRMHLHDRLSDDPVGVVMAYRSLPILLAAGICAAMSPRAAFGQKPLREVIDVEIARAWKQKKITPAPRCDDAAFLRRVRLDLTGVIPSSEETTAFLADKSSDKRVKLIDRLLADPLFAQHQADVWDLVLFGRDPASNEVRQRDAFQDWLRKQFATNRPYDQWVKEILLAPGDTAADGPATFYLQYHRRPEDLAMAVSRRFLGIQLQCARCHDHPFESWKQTDFYGFAAFFARLQAVSMGRQGRVANYVIGEKRTGEVLFTGPATDQRPGKKGTPVPAKFLGGDVLKEPEPPKKFREKRFPSNKVPPKPDFSRKERIAEWIVAPTNPYFTRAVANRVWAQFLGRGLVHPVDNMSPSNKPSHPELLKQLAEQLRAHKYDLKWYIRELCNSRAYQLAGTGSVAEAMPLWFERARVRPLSAEELAVSWRVATGYEEVTRKTTVRLNNARFAPLTGGYMLRFFGQPIDGVGNFQGGLHEHLYLNNGELGRLLTRAKGGLLHTLLNSKDDWPARVERLYLSVLNRRPTDAERKRFAAHITAGNPSDRLPEALWALMTSAEFRFNH